ncbi:MAG: FHA domain-containing protein [Planctomycetota bacterium]
MEFQYALRFESGERRGEVVPISVVTARGGSFTIGRKPGNSLQVTDPSVSGKHAELDVDGESVGIRDLDSTNGTHVGGRRVRQASLAHGDDFVLGAVEFRLLDTARPVDDLPASNGDLVLETDPAPAMVGDELGATRIQPRDDALEITAEDLARSRRSSKLGPIVVVVLAAVGGGLWWWLKKGDGAGAGGGRRGAAVAAVSPPAGNLLTKGYSFEGSSVFEEGNGWAPDESQAARFDGSSGARVSGRRGARAEVYRGETALLTSDAVAVPSNARSLRAMASVGGTGAGEVSLGLRFTSRDGVASSTVWSSPFTIAAEPADEPSVVSVVGLAPAGMDEVAVLVRGEGAGDARPSEDDESSDAVPSEIDVDDVALVPAQDSGLEAARHDEWSVTPVGGDGGGSVRAVAVSALDQPLVSSLRVHTTERVVDLSDLAMSGADGSVSLTVSSAGEAALRAEPVLVQAGVATMGPEGFASHGTSFERAGTTDVLLGSNASLVRIHFDPPVDLTARPAGEHVVVRGKVPAGAKIRIQVEFSAERTRAERLARQAKDARSAGDSGASLRIWSELLASVPFEQRLVDQAANEQAELIAEGRDALKALAQEVERARFFGLADLFREKLERVRALGAQFEGSVLEESCEALAEQIESELVALDAGKDRNERLRLEAVEAVLERRGEQGLATRVGRYKDGDREDGQREDS